MESGDSRPTDRQVEILAHVAAGRRPREIASEMHLSYHTIRHELVAIRAFYETSSMTNAVVQAVFADVIVKGEDGLPRPAAA